MQKSPEEIGLTLTNLISASQTHRDNSKLDNSLDLSHMSMDKRNLQGIIKNFKLKKLPGAKPRTNSGRATLKRENSILKNEKISLVDELERANRERTEILKAKLNSDNELKLVLLEQADLKSTETRLKSYHDSTLQSHLQKLSILETQKSDLQLQISD